jgi:hypothetical protein
MRITIDTKEDKPEEIMKAIELLNHVLGSEVKIAGQPESGYFNIFGDNNSSQAPSQPSQPQNDMFKPSEPEIQKEDFNVGSFIQEQAPEPKPEEVAKAKIETYY